MPSSAIGGGRAVGPLSSEPHTSCFCLVLSVPFCRCPTMFSCEDLLACLISPFQTDISRKFPEILQKERFSGSETSKLTGPELEKMQFHTPSHSIPTRLPPTILTCPPLPHHSAKIAKAPFQLPLLFHADKVFSDDHDPIGRKEFGP